MLHIGLTKILSNETIGLLYRIGMLNRFDKAGGSLFLNAKIFINNVNLIMCTNEIMEWKDVKEISEYYDEFLEADVEYLFYDTDTASYCKAVQQAAKDSKELRDFFTFKFIVHIINGTDKMDIYKRITGYKEYKDLELLGFDYMYGLGDGLYNEVPIIIGNSTATIINDIQAMNFQKYTGSNDKLVDIMEYFRVGNPADTNGLSALSSLAGIN